MSNGLAGCAKMHSSRKPSAISVDISLLLGGWLSGWLSGWLGGWRSPCSSSLAKTKGKTKRRLQQTRAKTCQNAMRKIRADREVS